MSKRQLNDFELKISKKNLERLSEDLEGIEKIDIAQKKLAIETAEISMNRQVKKLKQEVRALEMTSNTIKETIKVVEDQVENGVEEKKVEEENVEVKEEVSEEAHEQVE